MRTTLEVLRQQELEQEMIAREKAVTAQAWREAVQRDKENRILIALPKRDGQQVDIGAISEKTGVAPEEIIEIMASANYAEQRRDEQYYIVGEGLEQLRGDNRRGYVEESGREWMRYIHQNKPRDRHQPQDEKDSRWG